MGQSVSKPALVRSGLQHVLRYKGALSYSEAVDGKNT